MQKMITAATQRVIALVDMDCFYCQVEARLNPSLKGNPMAVVQYNQWKGGGIIAVNYEARDRGVTRYMRGDEAKEICPEIALVSVPTIRGKADLSNYRNAGDEVAKIFAEFSDCVQKASIDEAYLDLTKAVQNHIKSENENLSPNDLSSTFVVGYCNLKNKNENDRIKGLTQWLEMVESEKKNSADYLLAVGAKIVEKMRLEILNRTGFHCSAGIAHNKILAKLTAGLHKPKGQTVLPQDAVPELYETLPVYKVRNLGGKLGKQVGDKLSITYMSELYNFTLGELQQKFDEKISLWLYNIARGIDLEPVTSRLKPESIGCCKNFSGKSALTTKSEVEHWLKELASEISERLLKDLETNKRRATLLTVSFSQETSMSRCKALGSYEVEKIVSDALQLLKRFNNASINEEAWSPPIKFLGLSASKFNKETPSIEKYLTSRNEFENLNKPCDIPSTSNAHDENDHIIESKEPEHAGNSFLKQIEKPKDNAETDLINHRSKPSFFLEFLSSKRNNSSSKETTDNAKEEDQEEEAWISLSEVFPDINEADAEVVESLPEPLQQKFKERLNAINGEQETKQKSNSEGNLQDERKDSSVVETCNECGKKIPVADLLVHSDYHAALKLYAELNKPASSSSATLIINKDKSKDSKGFPKRKKTKAVTPSKKMKSLTSFFTSLTKK